MEIKPITNWHIYEKSKRYVEEMSNKKLTSEEKDKINVIITLIECFERTGKVDYNNVIVEPLIDQVFDSVKNVSNLEKEGIIERGLKLGEEYGELSAEILKFVGYKRSEESKEDIKNKILLESTDCLIMIFDIMSQLGFTREEICNMADKQINKWTNNLKK